MPLIGCETKVAFGEKTKAAMCADLLENAPTGSVNDTDQTLTEIADNGDVIDTWCKEYRT